MRNIVFAIAIFVACSSTADAAIEKSHKKRAIFREQLTPEIGGKIPVSAFRSDRLLLNRLQSEGIAVPDGITFEQRAVRVSQHTNRGFRPTYQVKIDSGGHYIAVPLADTTYPVKSLWHKKTPTFPPFKPILTHLEFPTIEHTQHATPYHAPKQSSNFANNAGFAPYYGAPSYNAPRPSYATHVITPFEPLPPPARWQWQTQQLEYHPQEVYNDLDTFITKWGSRILRDTRNQQPDVPKSI